LRDFKARFPQVPIHALNVIMRLSITHDTPEKVAYWRDVAIFSQLSYRVEKLGENRWEEALAEVKNRVPAEILEGYLRARERNHLINREVVKLAAEGTLESAILCQEDAAPVGLHVPEQEALAALAKELSAAERIFIHAGGDEASLISLTRAVCHLAGWQPRVTVSYASQEGAERVALYEDRPIADNVAGHIAACGAVQAGDRARADLALLVHTPTGPQREVIRRDAETNRRSHSQARWVVKRAAALLERGVRVSIADLAYCNGADPVLVGALSEADILPQLAGYGAWNTSGNSVGTALAQGLFLALAEEKPTRFSSQAIPRNLNFLFGRLVDSLLYQSEIRQGTNEWVESLGLSPVFLGDARAKTERFIRRRLKSRAREFFRTSFEGQRVAEYRISGLKKLVTRLPWPRTFEAEINAELELKPPKISAA
jgi:hypothetical protein